MSASLDRVARGDLCTGCGACVLAAPKKIGMEVVSPGYLRPTLSEPLTSAEDAQISQTCPGLTLTQDAPPEASDALWGPVIEARTGYATDPDQRYHASSGGGLSALATYLVTSGQADAVIQTTASLDQPEANRTVISLTSEDITACAGSRYAPSSPLAELEACLSDTSRQFVFIGKPCDVTALRALAKVDLRVDERIVMMISFFCAGIPSLTGAANVIRKLNFDPKTITAFRYRGDGWPGFAKATGPDGSTASMTYADSWGNILSSHVQHRCKICPDGTGGHADVVCADAWECDDKGYPLFEEQDGISLIVSRSQRGEALVVEAQAAGVLKTASFDLATLGGIQPGQYNRKRYLIARLSALRIMGKPIPQMTGFSLMAAARHGTLKGQLKNFAGTIKRALRK